MNKIVIDHWKNDVRFTLTGILVAGAIALALIFGPGSYGVAACLFLALISFNSESKVILDSDSQRVEIRRYLRPFGQPAYYKMSFVKKIKLDLSLHESNVTSYSAVVVFDSYDMRPVKLKWGTLRQVMDAAKEVSAVTGAPIEQSKALKEYFAKVRAENQTMEHMLEGTNS